MFEKSSIVSNIAYSSKSVCIYISTYLYSGHHAQLIFLMTFCVCCDQSLGLGVHNTALHTDFSAQNIDEKDVDIFTIMAKFITIILFLSMKPVRLYPLPSIFPTCI